MRLSRSAMLATLLVWGCAQGPEREAPEASVHGRRATLLPAHRTAKDAPGKADAPDADAELRLALPSLYAITVPPARPRRAMREWEPMAMLLAAYPAYMPEEPEVRATIVAMLGHTVRAAGTDVGVLTSSATARQDLTAGLRAWGLEDAEVAEKVHFYDVPVDSIWIVDYGPFPIVDDRDTVAFTDLRYYKSRVLDDGAPSRLALLTPEPGAPSLRTSTYRAPLSAEGGNLQSDGEGTCYTTTRLLATTGSTSSELLSTLRDYLGCEQLVVLHDITDDATGHVDMVFKLVARDRAVVGRYDQGVTDDPVNAARMESNAAIVRAVALPGGGSVAALEMPFPSKSKGIPRTFINATLVNGVTLWPVYEDDGKKGGLEAEARAVWEQALPGYTQIGVPSDRLASYSGAIHCISRTVPALPVAPWVGDGTCEQGLCDAPVGGFSGLCQVDGECTGAELECPCPVCNASCAKAACGDVPPAGLCAGPMVLRCDGGALTEEPCGGCCGVGASGASCTPECPAACADTCAEGEAGCDGAEHAWTCEIIEGCRRRVYRWCGGPTCADGACIGCGGLGAAGCCTPDGGAVMRCDGGSTVTVECAVGSSCGFSPAGFYACLPDGDSPGPDPTGAHPLACPATCVDTCAVGEAGCSDETARWTCIKGDEDCMVRARSPCAPGSRCKGGICGRDEDVDGGAGGTSELDGPGGPPGAAIAKTGAPDPSGGCGATVPGAGAGPAWLLLLAMLAGYRRATRARVRPAVMRRS